MILNNTREASNIEVPSKTCTKCGETFPITPDFFYRHKREKGGFMAQCKKCVSKYAWECRKTNKPLTVYKKVEISGGLKKCTKCDTWYESTLQFFSKNSANKTGLRSECRKCECERKRSNAVKTAQNVKSRNKSKCLFSAIQVSRISIYDETREDADGFLEVKCAYCGRWINPLIAQVNRRLLACENPKGKGESRFYCNDNDDACKAACPIYNVSVWPKGFKVESSREVVPEFRHVVLAFDDYKCLRCNKTIEETQLHVHHIRGAVQSPMEVADIQNAITLCKQCHKNIHKQQGCSTFDYRRKDCVV